MIHVSRTAALSALLTVGMLAAAACSVRTSPPDGNGDIRDKPSLQERSDGTAMASGWVTRVDLEGEFWALTAESPRAAESSSAVVAVLLPGKVTEACIASQQEAYVTVEGRLQRGLSTRMAGPEIVVDTISAVREE